MKLPITKDNAMGVAILAGVVIGVYFLLKKEAGDAAAALGDAVNPLNPDNVFARGVDRLGGTLTGDPSWSLGSWLYDQFNPAYDPNAQPFSTRKVQVGEQAAVFRELAQAD